MTTVILLRHGMTAMTGPVLAGWTPQLHLDERGRAQASAVAQRLAPLPLDAVVSSPLDRCLDTAAAVVAGRPGTAVEVDEHLGECQGPASWSLPSRCGAGPASRERAADRAPAPASLARHRPAWPAAVSVPWL